MSSSDSYIVTACVVWEEEGQLWHVPSVCVKCGMGSPDWHVSVQHPLLCMYCPGGKEND